MTSMDALTEVVRRINELDSLMVCRDQLIAQAREDRYTWDEIMTATGLTRQAAYNAVQRAKKAGFVPVPFGQNVKERLNRSSDAPKR